MDYNITHSGYLWHVYLNIFPYIGEFTRQLVGPYNINYTNSVISDSSINLCIDEDPCEIGGIYDDGGIYYTYRKFDLIYKKANPDSETNLELYFENYPIWKSKRLTYSDGYLYVLLNSGESSPITSGNMSDFQISNFSCIGSFDS